MNEVGGPHAHYLPRLPDRDGQAAWAIQGAEMICQLLDRPEPERESSAKAGIDWARRYEAHRAIDDYLKIYEKVLGAVTLRA